MIYSGKAEFGQISRSFSLNSGAILLKRTKNLAQICFPSLRSVKPDRLPGLNPENRIPMFVLVAAFGGHRQLPAILWWKYFLDPIASLGE